MWDDLSEEQLEAMLVKMRAAYTSWGDGEVKAVVAEGRRIEYTAMDRNSLRTDIINVSARLRSLRGQTGGKAIGVEMYG